MTDEQAVREWLAGVSKHGWSEPDRKRATQALALLDAKDAELITRRDENSDAWATATKAQDERDAALSRAKQAEARVAGLEKSVDERCVAEAKLHDLADRFLARAEQAEAALAEERKAHQTFREEVDAKVRAWQNAGCQGPYAIDDAVDGLHSLILPAKPADKLKECLAEAYGSAPEEFVNAFRAAIERAGGTIEFPQKAAPCSHTYPVGGICTHPDCNPSRSTKA